MAEVDGSPVFQVAMGHMELSTAIFSLPFHYFCDWYNNAK